MSLPARDRALRRLVADLAALRTDDISAVLDGFSPSERRAVERLLSEYTTVRDGRQDAMAETLEKIDLSQLSPWLVQRLCVERTDDGITAQARDALRDSAAHLFPASVKPASVARNDRPSLFARLTSARPGQGPLA